MWNLLWSRALYRPRNLVGRLAGRLFGCEHPYLFPSLISGGMTGYRLRRHRLDNLRGLWFRHYRFRSEETALGRFFCTSAIFTSISFCLSGMASRFACLSQVNASE